MLAITRKLGEKVFLRMPDGTQIEVVIADVRRDGRVRLAIGAPPEVKIYREEIAPPEVKIYREEIAPALTREGGK